MLETTASYRNVESNIANTMCKQFEADGVVSPLRKRLIMDNLDHNPISITAQSAFHGTVTQFPTSTDESKNCTSTILKQKQ